MQEAPAHSKQSYQQVQKALYEELGTFEALMAGRVLEANEKVKSYTGIT